MERLCLPSFYFEVTNAAHGTIGTKSTLLRIPELINMLFFLALKVVTRVVATLRSVIRNFRHAL